MRLLKAKAAGGFSLTKFHPNKVPRYAILSHTWEADDQEVTLQDITNATGHHKSGYHKIRFCRDQAERDGLDYFWVDSCCIDQSNSTELSTAVNSMFRWYQNAVKCYVYLSDVSAAVGSYWYPSFYHSRWFTRGWTLQELIAPKKVEFFSREGIQIGDKDFLQYHLQRITKVPIKVFQGTTPASKTSVEERMSWIGNRETTIEEDLAYSLFGIFDIHMPLIYGEGVIKSFRRLGEEIEKSSSFSQHRELTEEDRSCLKELRMNPLMYAAANGNNFLVTQLLNTGTAEVNSKDDKGRTPLSRAASAGHKTVVQVLLQAKADVHIKDDNGRTALLKAAHRGFEVVVKTLLLANADVDSVDQWGCSPLWGAARVGHEAVVKELLDANADVELRDHLGSSALLGAARIGHEAVVKALLQANADVDSEDQMNRTPLWWAVEQGHEEVVRLLLKAKARVNWKDNKGHTPLSIAQQKGYGAISRLLQSYSFSES